MSPQAPVRPIPRLALAVAMAVLALVAGLLTSSATASASPAEGPGSDRTAGTPAHRHAEAALARAEGLLAPRQGAHASSTAAADTGAHADATIALRDLGVRRPDLSAAEKGRADRLLARPVSPVRAGNADLAVHADASVTDAYVQQVLATAITVHDTYVAAGYREPKSDGTAGGDDRLDIYLTNLGSTGAYGYCASDQPTSSGPGRYDRWAFCVLDDGFTEFPGNPTQVLQVTLAHEYFHAVQYAYDSLEDGWFMEGTAVWAEDQVFDDVNDNMQYAPYSPLAGPAYSLDIFDPNGFRQYGSWLWFRWLSERFPVAQGGLPTIIRQFWEAADSTGGSASNRYSLQAISKVLDDRGLKLPKAFALFADTNRRPTTFYSEAAANAYPTAPLAGKVALSTRRPKTKVMRLDHLSSATTRYVPKRLTSKRYQLKLNFDLATKRDGSAVVVSSYLRSGKVRTTFVRLDSRGNGATKVPFSTRKVSGVEVTVVNASQRFTQCYDFGTTYSCYGKPTDEKVPEKVRAAVVK